MSNADCPIVTVLITGVKEMLAQGRTSVYERVLAAMERELFAEVLSHFNGNKTKAADTLGMARLTLRSKMASIGMKEIPQTDGIEPPG